MKKTAIIPLCVCLCSMVLCGGEFKFVQNGKAVSAIVLPQNAAQFEKCAAEDMQSYLKQMTGAELKIYTEGAKINQPAVYIGRTKFAVSKGADFNKLADEEYQILPTGRDLIVTGGGRIGSYYGTWKLLNRMGVWSISMEQDVVPQKKDAVLNVNAEKHAPTFASRIIYDGLPIHYKAVKMPADWFNRYGLYLLRNGINGRQHHIYTPPYVGKMSDIPHNPLHHTLSLYVPLWMFKTHPEYFAMTKEGKRKRPDNSTQRGGLCFSNPEVAKVTLDSLRKMIKRHRAQRPKEMWPILYDITPLDLAQRCECEKCRAIVQEEGGRELGLLLRYINYVAREIRKEYPDIVIRTSAYGGNRGVPKKTVPEKNVLIQLADYFVACDTFKPLTHEFNKPARTMFEEMAGMNCSLSMWDYWNMSGYCNPPRMEVVFDTIAPDFKIFKKCRVNGMFIEIEKHPYKPQNFLDLEFFVASQLMLDLNQDPEKLADVFMNGYYGKAAPDMKKLFNQLRDGVRKYPKLQGGMRTELWDYMTPEFLWNTWVLLENAAKKVPAGSRYQRRVQDESLSMLWLILKKRGKYLQYFNKKGLSREQLFEICKDRSIAHLKRYDATNLDFKYQYSATLYHCKNELARLNNAPLPVPKKFADIKPVDIRVFGIYHYNPLHDYDTATVDDPDSPTGKALKATDSNPAHHGVKAFLTGGKGSKKWSFRATQFGACDRGITIDPVAQDEKYHWYKIPNITLTEKSWFWGFYWHLQIIMDSAYQIDDGASKENNWDCYFSVKFTGPAYVKGSKKENAVWVDTIVLTRPGETKIRRR